MSAFCKQKPFIFQRMNLISVAVSSSIWNILMNVNTGSHTAFVAADNNLIGFSLSRLFTLGMCWAWVLLFRLCLYIMSLSECPFSGRGCMKTSSKKWIMSNSRCRERNDDPKRESYCDFHLNGPECLLLNVAGLLIRIWECWITSSVIIYICRLYLVMMLSLYPKHSHVETHLTFTCFPFTSCGDDAIVIITVHGVPKPK